MNAAAILLAAGGGERLASGVPKGFVELDGRPLIVRSIDAARECLAIKVVLVMVPDGWESRASELIDDGVEVVTGGETRQRSVARALDVLEGRAGRVFEAVVCHDVARPRASSALFDGVLAALERADGAIPAVPVSDTLKRVEDDHVSETIPRDGLVAVQTPQAFRAAALRAAHASGDDATDDAALVEQAGGKVVVVQGDPSNLKVTTVADLALAERLLDTR
jgi:2-C-methyl-D-erythritol 4-phosphate cytidylyltransferase